MTTRASQRKTVTTSGRKRAPASTAQKARPAGSTSPAPVPAGAPSGLRVRMYRVGFGDCFLISVPGADGPQHILVDCGVFKGTSGEGDIGTLEEAVANMVVETGGHLALIIMTHRHADHIIGFSRCRDQFAKLKVDAVWMPVWENEYEPNAQKFQVELTRVAGDMRVGLAAASPADQSDERHRQALRMVMNATGPLPAAGGGTNAASLNLLKTGLGVKPEYYAAGDRPALPDALAKTGLVAQILGPPPVKDMDLMKLMNLQKGVGQYLSARGVRDADDATLTPFAERWTVSGDQLPPSTFAEWGREKAGKSSGPRVRMQNAVKSAQPASLLEAAKTLDAFLNNQSLVVLFSFQEKHLLFAGDAQAGNWEHWLYDADAPDRVGSNPAGRAATEILSSLNFYKVGHHGSTNATPKAAVDALPDGLVAMCSTQAGVYGTAAQGTEVPRGPLLEQIEKKSSLVRSDQLVARLGGKTVPASPDVPGTIPTPKAGRFETGDCWIDYLF